MKETIKVYEDSRIKIGKDEYLELAEGEEVAIKALDDKAEKRTKVNEGRYDDDPALAVSVFLNEYRESLESGNAEIDTYRIKEVRVNEMYNASWSNSFSDGNEVVFEDPENGKELTIKADAISKVNSDLDRGVLTIYTIFDDMYKIYVGDQYEVIKY